MNRTVTMLIACTVVLLIGASVCADPIFRDDSEPDFEPGWSKCSGSSEKMWLDTRSCFNGTHSALAQPNWRWTYTMCRALPAAYSENIFFSAWVRDECTITPGLPGPPDNPNWSSEHTPHALIRMSDSNGVEFFHLGCIGKNKTATDPQWLQNVFFSANTAHSGVKLLNGPPNSPVVVRREPGWRKWMLRLKPYTGGVGDLEMYLDGQLVYSGIRQVGPMGPGSIDGIGVGSNTWTGEWMWYDEFECDYWPTPVTATTVADALTNPDGTWVRIDNLNVDTVEPDSVTVSDTVGGTIEAYPARFEAPGDVINVLGRLTTSGSTRYLDTLTVDRVATVPTVTVTSLADARALPDGTRVTLPEEVVTSAIGAIRFVQNAERTTGLKIRNVYEPAVGDKIVVEGQMMTVGPEKLMEAEKVTIVSKGNTLPKPVGVRNKDLYTPNLIPGGMLVVTTGQVVNRPDSGTWFPAWCEIRDGSQPDTAFPIRVLLPYYSSCPDIGDYVWVRGAVGCLVQDAGSRPVITCRYQNYDDIQVIPR